MVQQNHISYITELQHCISRNSSVTDAKQFGHLLKGGQVQETSRIETKKSRMLLKKVRVEENMTES